MVTGTTCVYYKRHPWKIIETSYTGDAVHQIRWCRKCGSLTEFYKNSRKDRRWHRTVDPKFPDCYFIEIPEIVKKTFRN